MSAPVTYQRLALGFWRIARGSDAYLFRVDSTWAVHAEGATMRQEWAVDGKGAAEKIGPVEIQVDADPGGIWRVWLTGPSGNTRIEETQSEALAKTTAREVTLALWAMVDWARSTG